MTEQEIFAGFAEIIEELMGVPASEVTLETGFVDDLGVDSLLLVEIVVSAQDKFGVEIPDEDIRRLKVVKDVVLYVQRLAVSM